MADERPDDDIYRAAFERLDDTALIVGRDGTVLALTGRLGEVLGGEPRGASVETLAAGHSSALLDDIRTAAAGNPVALRLRDAEGGSRRFGGRVVPLPGSARGAAAYLVVLGDKRPVAATMETLNDELREARERYARECRERREAERRLERLEEFSQHTAHDLKAPLLQIGMILDLIDEDHGRRLPEDGVELLGRARRSAGRLRRLIDTLLDHARLDGAALERSPQSLDRLLEELLEDFDGLIADAGATIRVEGPLGEVDGDAVLIRQLLENLLSNAVKYRDAERPLCVRVTASTQRGRATELRVRDNGQGFGADQATKIFEPFVRAHSGAVEGTGIGLSACRKICERHGWRIEAQGREGEGAEFRIRFLEPTAAASLGRAA